MPVTELIDGAIASLWTACAPNALQNDAVVDKNPFNIADARHILLIQVGIEIDRRGVYWIFSKYLGILMFLSCLFILGTIIFEYSNVSLNRPFIMVPTEI